MGSLGTAPVSNVINIASPSFEPSIVTTRACAALLDGVGIDLITLTLTTSHHPHHPSQTLLDGVGIDLDGDNDACDETK